MNWKLCCCLTLVTCYGVYAAGAVHADLINGHEINGQLIAGMQVGPPPGLGGPFEGPERTAVVRNEPYQAEAITEIRQTLADGTHIRQTITATVARDKQGRTVRVERLGWNGAFFVFRAGGNGSTADVHAQPPILTSIFDPVSHEHIVFTSDVKVAHVSPIGVLPGKPIFRNASPGAASRATQQLSVHHIPGAADMGGPSFRLEFAGGCDGCDTETKTLGSRTVDGVKAIGTRRTWTIPVSAIGNDRPIVTTEDTWYSPKLQLVLLSMRRDARFGNTTYMIKGLRLENPKESLFRIPAGYTLQRLDTPPRPFDPTDF